MEKVPKAASWQLSPGNNSWDLTGRFFFSSWEQLLRNPNARLLILLQEFAEEVKRLCEDGRSSSDSRALRPFARVYFAHSSEELNLRLICVEPLEEAFSEVSFLASWKMPFCTGYTLREETV